MATNTNNSTNNNTSYVVWTPLPASQCIPWIVVLITECLATVILNIITIVVFVKQRKLQRQSTYLIMHLAIVDLLAGAVSMPLNIEFTGSMCGLWKDTWPLKIASLLLYEVARLIFPTASFFNLALISLERLHATFCPFKHRFIKNWVYGVIISVSWLVLVMGLAIGVLLSSYFSVIATSYFFILLIIICVCYVSIYLKVRCSRRPQHHGAAGLRERKLTITLFLVTFVSFLACLPGTTMHSLMVFNLQLGLGLSRQSYIHLCILSTFFFSGNSLINPIIYAMRMPELRASILQVIFRRAPNRLNHVVFPLQNL